MKFKNIAFPLITLLFLVFCLKNCSSYYIKRYKFEKQKLGVRLEEFKSDWGDPEKETIFKGMENEIILFYDCDEVISGNRYVFKFDCQNKKLTFKYYDD